MAPHTFASLSTFVASRTSSKCRNSPIRNEFVDGVVGCWRYRASDGSFARRKFFTVSERQDPRLKKKPWKKDYCNWSCHSLTASAARSRVRTNDQNSASTVIETVIVVGPATLAHARLVERDWTRSGASRRVNPSWLEGGRAVSAKTLQVTAVEV